VFVIETLENARLSGAERLEKFFFQKWFEKLSKSTHALVYLPLYGTFTLLKLFTSRKKFRRREWFILCDTAIELLKNNLNWFSNQYPEWCKKIINDITLLKEWLEMQPENARVPLPQHLTISIHLFTKFPLKQIIKEQLAYADNLFREDKEDIFAAIDLLLNEVLTELAFLGYKADFLYQWMEAIIRSSGATPYMEPLLKMEILNKTKYYVLRPIAEIKDPGLHSAFIESLEYYRNYEGIEEISEKGPFWMINVEAAVDPQDAVEKAIESFELIKDKVKLLNKIIVVQEAKERKRIFYFHPLQSRLGFIKYIDQEHLDLLKKIALTNNSNKRTLKALWTAFYWYTRANSLNKIHQRPVKLITLWTAFTHLFSRTDMLKYLPSYVINVMVREKILSFKHLLEIYRARNHPLLETDLPFGEWRRKESGEELFINFMDVVQFCHEALENEHPIMEDPLLSWHVKEINYLINPEGFLKEMKKLEQQIMTELILIKDLRNAITHRADYEGYYLPAALKKLYFFFSSVFSTLVFTFYNRRWRSLVELHESIYDAVYFLKEYLRTGKTPPDAELLINPVKKFLFMEII